MTAARRPSGAARRRAARDRAEAKRRDDESAQRARKAMTVAMLKAIDRALTDGSLGVLAGHTIALAVAREVAADPNLPSVDRWRTLSGVAGRLGLLHARASLEAQLVALRKNIEGPQRSSSDELESSEGLRRPATSRFATPEDAEAIPRRRGDA